LANKSSSSSTTRLILTRCCLTGRTICHYRSQSRHDWQYRSTITTTECYTLYL